MTLGRILYITGLPPWLAMLDRGVEAEANEDAPPSRALVFDGWTAVSEDREWLILMAWLGWRGMLRPFQAPLVLIHPDGFAGVPQGWVRLGDPAFGASGLETMLEDREGLLEDTDQDGAWCCFASTLQSSHGSLPN